MDSEKSRILIVDDQPVGRQLLESFLYDLDYELFFAEDGEQAYEYTQKHKPHLVLLDVMMPKLDGFEVCKLIRKNKEIDHTPVIMVTALEDRDSRLQGISAGADDYITKPIDRIELLARVKNIVELSRYRFMLQSPVQSATDEPDRLYGLVQSHFISLPVSSPVKTIYKSLPAAGSFTYSLGVSAHDALHLLYFARMGESRTKDYLPAAMFPLFINRGFQDLGIAQPVKLLQYALESLQSSNLLAQTSKPEIAVAIAQPDKRTLHFAAVNFGISLNNEKMARGVSASTLGIVDILNGQLTESTIDYSAGDLLVWMPASSREGTVSSDLPGLLKGIDSIPPEAFEQTIKSLPGLANAPDFAIMACKFE